MNREQFQKGYTEGLVKSAATLDKIVSIGMNVLDEATRSRIADKLPIGPIRNKVLAGEPLSPFMVKLFRSTYESS
jgi:hypothetical protein